MFPPGPNQTPDAISSIQLHSPKPPASSGPAGLGTIHSSGPNPYYQHAADYERYEPEDDKFSAPHISEHGSEAPTLQDFRSLQFQLTAAKARILELEQELKLKRTESRATTSKLLTKEAQLTNLQETLVEKNRLLQDTKKELEMTKVSLRQTRGELSRTEGNLMHTRSGLGEEVHMLRDSLIATLASTQAELQEAQEAMTRKELEFNVSLGVLKEERQLLHENMRLREDAENRLRAAEAELANTHKKLVAAQDTIRHLATQVSISETILRQTKSTLSNTQLQLESTRKDSTPAPVVGNDNLTMVLATNRQLATKIATLQEQLAESQRQASEWHDIYTNTYQQLQATRQRLAKYEEVAPTPSYPASVVSNSSSLLSTAPRRSSYPPPFVSSGHGQVETVTPKHPAGPKPT